MMLNQMEASFLKDILSSPRTADRKKIDYVLKAYSDWLEENKSEDKFSSFFRALLDGGDLSNKRDMLRKHISRNRVLWINGCHVILKLPFQEFFFNGEGFSKLKPGVIILNYQLSEKAIRDMLIYFGINHVFSIRFICSLKNGKIRYDIDNHYVKREKS